MAQFSANDKISRKYFGDSSQLTNWILVSVATCNMTIRVPNFIPGFLEDMDKYMLRRLAPLAVRVGVKNVVTNS